MTEKNIKKFDTILSRLHFIEVGAKHIKDSCKAATIDVTLNNKFPQFMLEQVEMKFRKRYKCSWFSEGSLYIEMKFCSVKLRKI